MVAHRTKRRGGTVPASAGATACLRELAGECRTLHPEIWARWHDIAGAHMYARTFPRHFRDGLLTIGVSSSAWMQEISLLKDRLLERIADAIGPDIVRDLRLVVDTTAGSPRHPAAQSVAPSPPNPDTSRLAAELRDAANRIDDEDLAEAVKRAAVLFQEKKR